jgi:DnaJ-class molecular chaperone
VIEILFTMFRIIILYWILGKIFGFFFRRTSRSGYSNQYAGSRNMFGSKIEDSYQVLNVSPFSSDSEIESAYKKLAVQFHPDKTLNMGPDLIKLSEQRMKEINSAYDDIKKQRKKFNGKF